MRIRGSQQKHMNLRIWGFKDVWMSTSTHEAEGIRMWECKNTSMHTWTWGHEDVRIRGYTHEPEVQESTLQNTLLA